METAGGAMLGYCATESRLIETAPASMTMIASTQAKIGRSMKNLDIEPPSACRGRDAGRAVRSLNDHRLGPTVGREHDLLGGDLGPGPGHLQPLDDQPVAVIQPFGHQPFFADCPIRLQHAQLD